MSADRGRRHVRNHTTCLMAASNELFGRHILHPRPLVIMVSFQPLFTADHVTRGHHSGRVERLLSRVDLHASCDSGNDRRTVWGAGGRFRVELDGIRRGAALRGPFQRPRVTFRSAGGQLFRVPASASGAFGEAHLISPSNPFGNRSGSDKCHFLSSGPHPKDRDSTFRVLVLTSRSHISSTRYATRAHEDTAAPTSVEWWYERQRSLQH
jgi:hypothetical protein